MNEKTLKAAEAAASLFLARVSDLRDAMTADQNLTFWEPSKKKAAVRRASMDLTRALVDMRRPG